MIILCPKQTLNLDPSRIAVFEDCKDTVLTTQPQWLDISFKCFLKLHDKKSWIKWFSQSIFKFPHKELFIQLFKQSY